MDWSAELVKLVLGSVVFAIGAVVCAWTARECWRGRLFFEIPELETALRKRAQWPDFRLAAHRLVVVFAVHLGLLSVLAAVLVLQRVVGQTHSGADRGWLGTVIAAIVIVLVADCVLAVGMAAFGKPSCLIPPRFRVNA